MSDDDATAQLILSQFSPTLTVSYISVSAAVMYYYDCILTLPLEISEIWTGKVTLTKGLYIANKYITLFSITCAFTQAYYKIASDAECNTLYYISTTCAIFINTTLNGIFILRIYAIYERSIIILLIFVIPTIGIVIGSIISTIGIGSTAYPTQLQIGPFTCQNAQTLPVNVYDVGTIGIVIESRKAGCKKGITYIILRDGLLYYFVVCVPSIVEIALEIYYMRSKNTNWLALTILSAYFNLLQILITNRLVLSLKRAGDQRDDSMYRTMTGLEPPAFATNPMLGNIGAPLRTGYSDDDFLSNTSNGSTFDDDEKSRMVDIELMAPGASRGRNMDKEFT